MEFNLPGIMARNDAGISTVKSVMSYLLDGVKAATGDLKKIQCPTSPWKQPLGGVEYRKSMM